MSASTLERTVTQSEVYLARTPTIVLEHTEAGPAWAYVYIDEDELWPLPEPDQDDLW